MSEKLPPAPVNATDVGVIALVPDPWHGMSSTTRHHVLRRLANHFHVVWVEPSIYWREYVRQPSLLREPHRLVRVSDRLDVLPPSYTTPRCYRPRWLADHFERRRLRQAAALLHAKGCRRIVLYVWRPEFAAALDLVDGMCVAYHIDDEYTFSKVDQPVGDVERDLIRRADHVFVHSHALFEKKGRLNPHTSLVPNGVDFHLYSLPAPEPDDLRHIPHPRIGYVGVIKQQLDLDLQLQVARANPGWSFVFVGPIGAMGDQQAALDALTSLPNCHFIERRPVAALPGYMQHMDVCTLCYVADGYTRYIYPLKLHEYLAAGRPVVATPLPALEEFRDVVAFADSCAAWTRAIEQQLEAASQSAQASDSRRRIASRYEWDELVSQIAGTMSAALMHRTQEVT